MHFISFMGDGDLMCRIRLQFHKRKSMLPNIAFVSVVTAPSCGQSLPKHWHFVSLKKKKTSHCHLENSKSTFAFTNTSLVVYNIQMNKLLKYCSH